MRTALVSLLLFLAGAYPARPAARVLYPPEGAVFPPDISAPTFVWREDGETAVSWQVEVRFADGSAQRYKARGDKLEVGEIDPRCVAATNQLPS